MMSAELGGSIGEYMAKSPLEASLARQQGPVKDVRARAPSHWWGFDAWVKLHGWQIYSRTHV
jgi:hypothetical protein